MNITVRDAEVSAEWVGNVERTVRILLVSALVNLTAWPENDNRLSIPAITAKVDGEEQDDWMFVHATHGPRNGLSELLFARMVMNGTNDFVGTDYLFIAMGHQAKFGGAPLKKIVRVGNDDQSEVFGCFDYVDDIWLRDWDEALNRLRAEATLRGVVI